MAYQYDPERLVGRRRSRSSFAISKSVSALLVSITVAGCVSQAKLTDPLSAGFQDPPPQARPYAWWHWLNGNVTAEGAKRDLEWMKLAGIGGVQIFEGSLGTPRIVEEPIVWNTPAWREVLKEAVSHATSLGLDVSVASSPGWSATGAPFVQPEDAMKKLVWSRTDVPEGLDGAIQLAEPPAVAGPFQDVAVRQGSAPAFYRDIAVLAVPRRPDAAKARMTLEAQPFSDADRLADDRFGEAVNVPVGADRTATLEFDFGKSIDLSSFTMGLIAPTGFGAPPAPDAVVELSTDGRSYREVARLRHTPAQARAASFAPVTARFARLRLVGSAAGGPPVGPGVVGMQPPSPARTYALTEARFSTAPQVNRWVEKAGFATAPDYYALATDTSVGEGVPLASDIVNLTSKLRPDGSLEWTAPPGEWSILRFGYSLTGEQNAPAPVEATGLEVDKLDREAVGRYIDRYLGLYESAVGPDLIGKRGINGLLSDSIESGAQNWTPQMLQSFKRLRGYDALPWLPVLTGQVIESSEASDRFLWDFRTTISDLLTDSHYGVLAQQARERGLTYYAEALEDHRPQIGDDLAMRARADIPMGAMWWFADGTAPRSTLIADIQGASSVANVYGKRFVAAESFTAFGHPWNFAPSDLKATADLGFALGVNRVVIHTSAHQPFANRPPGFALSPLLGQYFTRNETWAGMARAWTDYLARSAWMLQQGHHAADVAYFVGEEAPVTALYGDAPFSGLPAGYGFDFVGPEALQTSLGVQNGEIVSAGNVHYRLLALGGSSAQITTKTLRHLLGLARQGATIVGNRPIASPSLGDDKSEWASLVSILWGDAATPRNAVGKGWVYLDLADALQALRLSPDWKVEEGDPGALAVLHRRLPDGELWYVANRSAALFRGTLSLRGAGRSPEFWEAMTGGQRLAPFRSFGGRTYVPVELGASGSTFIMMRHRTSLKERKAFASRETEVISLDSGWSLALENLQGGHTITLPRLISWTELPSPAQRFHSGTGHYRNIIQIPERWLRDGRRVHLDLGDVADVAEVFVNGNSAGIVWFKPFRVDLTGKVRAGDNLVEVRVANLWINRLIGDARTNGSCTTVYGPTYRPDAALRPSGLLGPVRVRSEGTAR